VGSNAYYLGHVDRLSQSQLENKLKAHAKEGAKVLRVFAHMDGYRYGIRRPLQPKLGQYDETALARLDALVSMAGKYGLKLIMVFSNFEPFTGGMEFYKSQLSDVNEKEGFYTNYRARNYYKEYVKKIVLRKNTVDGKLYKDSPVIFAWELMNEPHTTNLYERNRGIRPGSIAGDWIRDMAKFVKGLDSNHMLLTGEEGYGVDGPLANSREHRWIDNGYKGVDFKRNCADPNIDACTIHAYPDNWGFDYGQLKTYGPLFLEPKAAIAHSFGKPIMMEEYGVRPGYGNSMYEVLKYLQNEANRLDYACTLVWQVEPGTQNNGAYVFGYNSGAGSAVRQQYNYINNKFSGAPPPNGGGGSNPCTDIPPSSRYTCAQQAKWGKCNRSWMQPPYCLKSCNRC